MADSMDKIVKGDIVYYNKNGISVKVKVLENVSDKYKYFFRVREIVSENVFICFRRRNCISSYIYTWTLTDEPGGILLAHQLNNNLNSEMR